MTGSAHLSHVALKCAVSRTAVFVTSTAVLALSARTTSASPHQNVVDPKTVRLGRNVLMSAASKLQSVPVMSTVRRTGAAMMGSVSSVDASEIRTARQDYSAMREPARVAAVSRTMTVLRDSTVMSCL